MITSGDHHPRASHTHAHSLYKKGRSYWMFSLCVTSCEELLRYSVTCQVFISINDVFEKAGPLLGDDKCVCLNGWLMMRGACRRRPPLGVLRKAAALRVSVLLTAACLLCFQPPGCPDYAMLSFMGSFHGRTLGKTSTGTPPPSSLCLLSPLHCHLTMVPEMCFIFLSLLFSIREV